MPSRQPRKPSMGLNSCSSWTRLCHLSTEMPSCSATSCWPCGLSCCGRNSCKRRIEQANAGRPAGQRPEDAFEILLLMRQQFGKAVLRSSRFSARIICTHGDDAVAFEEHVLGAAQADAFRAEGDGVFYLIGLIGVGANAQLAVLVGQLHQRVVILKHFAIGRLQRLADEHLLQFAIGGFDRAVENFAGRAVDADRHRLRAA